MSKNEFLCDCNIVHKDAVDYVLNKMPSKEVFDKMSTFFKVAGNLTRIKIIWALDEKELCVCDIANILSMTKSAVSHQLSILRNANLVKFRKAGKTVYYSLNDNHVKLMLESALQHIHD